VIAWRLLGRDVAAPQLVVTTAAVGAATALVLLLVGPSVLRDHAATAFALGYVGMVGWSLVWAHELVVGFAWTALALAATSMVVVMRSRCSERTRWELAKAAAGTLWVLTCLLMPVFLFGLAFLAPALALTSVSRRRRFPAAAAELPDGCAPRLITVLRD
jgi:hypothetical protein